MKLPSIPAFLLLLAALTAGAHAQTFVANPGMDNALAQWVKNDIGGTIHHDYLAQAEIGGGFDTAIAMTNRSNAQDGVKQDIRAALTAAPGYVGRRFVTRFSVKTSAFASVRCFLARKSSPTDTTPPVLLAEQVIRTPGQWAHVEGVAVIAWTALPQKANIYFEVQQFGRPGSPAIVQFPDYTLDNFFLALDDDGDGLANSEEPTPPGGGPDPSQTADSDGDHMPDNWEARYLTVGPDDDPDLDGYTNLEEYFAATDPKDAASVPGVPCDPDATNFTKALLRYLALLPSKRYNLTASQHVVVGQMVSDSLPANSANPNAFTNNITKLATQTAALGQARWPAILGLAVEGSVPLQVVEGGILADQWIADGGIVQFKFRPWNPWTGTLNGISGVNIDKLIHDPTDPAYVVFEGWLTVIADTLESLYVAHPDTVIMFRPYSEMNGGWFWWGQLAKDDYEALWRYTYKFMIDRGLHHLIWVYEADSSVHAPDGAGSSSTPCDYYYPGDDVVDVMGHNLYSDTWDLDFDENDIYRRYPKVCGIPQAGSASGGAYRVNGSFDNLTYINKIDEKYPRVSYFIVWNSFGGVNGAPNQYVSIADNLHYGDPGDAGLMNHSSIVTRDELAWRPPIALTASPSSPYAAQLAWAPPAGEKGSKVEASLDGGSVWLDAGATTTGNFDLNVGSLTPASSVLFRVRAIYDAGPSGASESVLVVPPGYPVWDPADQPEADNNEDGVSNLMAYALNAGDPAEDATDLLPFVQADFSGGYVAASAVRNDLHYTVYYSIDLQNWFPAAEKPIGGAWSAQDTNFSVLQTGSQIATTPVASFDQLFYRLEAAGQ